MIIILHGQDDVASRNYLSNLVSKDPHGVLKLEKVDLQVERLSQIVSGLSLFGETRKIVIENYLKQRSFDKGDAIREMLNTFLGEVVLWEDGQRLKTALSYFNEARIMEFKVPSVVFKFLDNVRPLAAKENIVFFRQALVGSSPEIIFSLLARRFVDLLSPSEKAADWQKVRLKNQANFFSEMRIKVAIEQLLEMDIAQKTSLTPLLLGGQIELFLSKL